MPICTQDDATGYGFSPHQATLIAANPTVLTTKGTSQTTAATLISRNTELSTAASQTGAIPPSTSLVMAPYFLNNQQATTAIFYVPVGHYLNSVQNASVNIAQYKGILVWQYKPKYWCYVLSA